MSPATRKHGCQQRNGASASSGSGTQRQAVGGFTFDAGAGEGAGGRREGRDGPRRLGRPAVPWRARSGGRGAGQAAVGRPGQVRRGLGFGGGGVGFQKQSLSSDKGAASRLQVVLGAKTKIQASRWWRRRPAGASRWRPR